MRVSLFNRLLFFILFSFLFSFAQEKVDYKTPLSFEKNVGQKDGRVQFSAHGQGFALFLTKKSMVFDFARKINNENDIGPKKLSHNPHEQEKPTKFQHEALFVEFLDINSNIKVVGEDLLPGKSNYFIGNDPEKWHTDINHYAKIRYKNIYPGIDLLYYSINGQIEYDFILSPGADPNQIKLHYKGAKSLDTDEQGNLLIEMDFGIVSHKAPVIYQRNGNKKASINGSYEISSDNQVSFQIETFDQNKALIIDPVLGYSAFIGGASGASYGYDITLDGNKNAYVTGYAYITDFPTVNPYQTHQGYWDVIISKLSSDGSTLLYSTYLGGTGSEIGWGIAIDSSNNIYVTGETSSTNFPTTASAFQTTLVGVGDAFITKLNSAGNALVYSTYIGGSLPVGYDKDIGKGIKVDSNGNAYVAGTAYSNNFPLLNAVRGDGYSVDTFALKMNNTGTALIFSTYLSGNGSEYCTDIALDSADNSYITGETSATDFALVNHFQANQPGYDAFVTKLNSTGGWVYSTYIGGSGNDIANSIAVDNSGNAYIAGDTYSSDFPTKNPYQTTNNGSKNGFVTKLDSTGGCVYSTYLGGQSSARIVAIEIDSNENAFVTGKTGSNDFPLVNSMHDDIYGNCGFISKFNSTGNSLIYSSLFGYSSDPNPYGIAVDNNGDAYITGRSYSTIPTTINAYRSPIFSSSIFISKIIPLENISLEVSGVTDPIVAGTSSDITVSVKDNLGQPVDGYNRTLVFSSILGTNLPALYTFDFADGDSHTFTGQIVFNTPGEQTVTTYDFNYPILNDSQTAITVLPSGGNTTNSSATVPAGKVGETTSISILINDALSNPIQAGDDLVVSIGGQ